MYRKTVLLLSLLKMVCSGNPEASTSTADTEMDDVDAGNEDVVLEDLEARFKSMEIVANQGILEVLHAAWSDSAEVLKNSGLNLDIADSSGITMLQFFIFAFNDLDRAEKMVLAGADVNHVDSSGTSIFERAVSNGNYEAVCMLLKSGRCNIHGSEDVNVQSPIFCAVYSGNADVVRLLLHHGANVNGTRKIIEENKKENTISVLHAAVDQGDVKILEAVLEGKPLLDVRDTADWTPLEAAYKKNRDRRIIEALKKANSPPAREEFRKEYMDNFLNDRIYLLNPK